MTFLIGKLKYYFILFFLPCISSCKLNSLTTANLNELKFGAKHIGVTSGKEYIFHNSDKKKTSIETVAIEGDNFYIYHEDCRNRKIKPRDSCIITIYFTPENLRDYKGKLLIKEFERPNFFLVELSGSGREN